MKRIKNFVIGGIENKVFNLILMTVILLTAAYLAVSAYHGKMLKDLAADSAERQQTAIEETISSVMDSVVDSSMYRSTGLEAYIVNEMFYGLETRVRMLGEYAEKLFSGPDSYPRMSYSTPDAGKNGEVLPQTIFADGVDDSSPELKDRIGLAANLSDMMVSLFGVSAETNSCFIALSEGVFLVTDDRTAAKYSEDGSPVSYDPRTRPWYQKAVEEGQLIFYGRGDGRLYRRCRYCVRHARLCGWSSGGGCGIGPVPYLHAGVCADIRRKRRLYADR